MLRLRLREMRKSRGMTQTQLANAVGIKQPSLSSLENGVTEPALKTLIKLAKALECSLDELVDQNDDSVAS